MNSIKESKGKRSIVHKIYFAITIVSAFFLSAAFESEFWSFLGVAEGDISSRSRIKGPFFGFSIIVNCSLYILDWIFRRLFLKKNK